MKTYHVCHAPLPENFLLPYAARMRKLVPARASYCTAVCANLAKFESQTDTSACVLVWKINGAEWDLSLEHAHISVVNFARLTQTAVPRADAAPHGRRTYVIVMMSSSRLVTLWAITDMMVIYYRFEFIQTCAVGTWLFKPFKSRFLVSDSTKFRPFATWATN